MKMNGLTYDSGTAEALPPAVGGLKKSERASIGDFWSRRGEMPPAERRAALKAHYAAQRAKEVRA